MERLVLKEVRGAGVSIVTSAHVNGERALIVETTKRGNCKAETTNVICINERNLIRLLDSMREHKDREKQEKREEN